MAYIRYIIRRLQVATKLSYANPIENDVYSFSLTLSHTKSVIMGNGEALQEDNAIFFQPIFILHVEEYKQLTETPWFSILQM